MPYRYADLCILLRVQRVGIVGASGYAGGELLRLLIAHPHLEVASAMAASQAGEEISSVHPHLGSALSGLRFDATDPERLADHDLVFLALPHGQSAALVAQLPANVKVVDLGADFRLASAAAWSAFYGGPHAGTWTYGLSEWNRGAIATSDRVANPGCYATAIELGILPVASEVDPDIVVVAASGTTGAGRVAKANLLASEVMGSMSPYKVGGIHQHTPEIEESIAAFSGASVHISFTPLLAPMPRGIIATISMRSALSEAQARSALLEAYAGAPFVRVLEEGRQPSTASTLGANSALLQVVRDERAGRLVITVALDNLVKGAAGQAVQNANLMLGLDEAVGLSALGIAP